MGLTDMAKVKAKNTLDDKEETKYTIRLNGIDLIPSIFSHYFYFSKFLSGEDLESSFYFNDRKSISGAREITEG